MNCACGLKYQAYAPLLLRLAVGTIFIVHGYQKLTGLEGFTGFLASLGVPLASTFAIIVMIVELGGGIALILGLWTHWVSKLQAVDMIFAIFLVHAGNGFLNSNMGYEFPLLLLAASLSFVIAGAGPLSLDAKMHRNNDTMEA